ncbi:MAG: lysozyme [Ruminococcus sp.]|nr:lysozyme [Ruminococcus sp.]
MNKKLLCAIFAMFFIFFATSCTKAETEETTTPESSVAEVLATEPVTWRVVDESSFQRDENGFLTYSDERVYSLTGIDVSSYSGDIDWKKVAESGVEFVMIRLGGRGYGDSGTLYTDENARRNIDGARQNGIMVGGYFFSQATSEDEAAQEAEYALSIVGDDKLDLPIAYDFEHIKDDDARTDNVTDDDIEKFADTFGQVMLENGYEPMVYGDDEEFGTIYKESDMLRWIAEYDDTPEIDESVKIWQHSENITVDGISGTVDLNIMFMER